MDLGKTELHTWCSYIEEHEKRKFTFKDLQKWAKAKCKAIYKLVPEMNSEEQVMSLFVTTFLKENFDLMEDPDL